MSNARHHAHAHDHDHGATDRHQEPISPPFDHGRAWLRASLWLSLTALALWVLLAGHTDLYIAPNVRWTLWLACAVSVALVGVEIAAIWASGAGWPAWRWPAWRGGVGYALLFTPLLAGVLVPPATLGAGSIAANDGVVALLPPPALPQGSLLPAAPRALSLLQARDALLRGDLATGAAVTLTGFVYRDPALPAGEWLLTRFITPHCVAEAQPVAIVVRGVAPPANAWVSVTGTLAGGAAEGRAAALLTPTVVARIAIPLDPYLIY